MEIKRSLIIRDINLQPPCLAAPECCNISNFHNQLIIVIKYHSHYQEQVRPDGLCNPIPWLEPLNRELRLFVILSSPSFWDWASQAVAGLGWTMFYQRKSAKGWKLTETDLSGRFLVGQWHGHALAASERWRRFNDRQDFLSFSFWC